MDVLILSAGKGERLYPLTKNTPKALLDLGNGETLIENQLAVIESCGAIDRVFVVGGYRVEQIEAKLAHYDGVPLEIIFNPFFDRTNNLVSVWLGLLSIPSKEVITINGDDLFKAPVLEALVAAPPSHEICMVVDRPATLTEDDMKVVTAQGLVQEVSKQIPSERANGESVGIIRFRERGLRVYRETLNRLVRSKQALDWFYLAAIQEVIARGFPVHFVECDESMWAEVDFHNDLRDLRQIVATDAFLQDGQPVPGTLVAK